MVDEHLLPLRFLRLMAAGRAEFVEQIRPPFSCFAIN
jgi:hypothetical protein